MSRKGLKLSNLYFVLYLLAIVLLLPDKQDRSDTSDIRLIESLLSVEFEVSVSPGLLSARAVVTNDSAFFADLSNRATIFFSDAITQPEFSYRVSSVRQGADAVLTGNLATDGSITPEISIVRSGPTELELKWEPELAKRRDELLQVTVVVEGHPVVPKRLQQSLEADQIQQYIDKGLRVRDSVIVLLNFSVDETSSARFTAGTAGVDTVYASSTDTVFMQTDQAFSVTSYTPFIQVLEGQAWENIVTFSRSISENAQIQLLPEQANARFSQIANNQLLVQGVASGSARSQYSVSITDTQGLTTRVNFTVQSSLVQEPTLPAFMFPDIAYSIDPGFPSHVAGLQIEVRCLIGGVVVYTSGTGAEFELSADQKHVGQNIVLQRKVDGTAYGKVYSIPVRAYPQPEVVSVQRSNGDVILKTRSYGVYQQLPNRIRIAGTGIEVQELTGSVEFDETTHAIIQTFVLSEVAVGTTVQINDARGRSVAYTIGQ